MGTSQRIEILKKLVEEYYPLKKGIYIDKHLELLSVVTIKDVKKEKHPHLNYEVYISRMALKHVVEERKIDLTKRHTEEETLLRICFAIEQLSEIFLDFDKYKYEYELEEEKHFYTKHYPKKSSIRVLVDEKSENNSLEIRSVHFTKHKKDK